MAIETTRADGWWTLRYAGQIHCADADGITISVDAPGTEWAIEVDLSWDVFASLWSRTRHPQPMGPAFVLQAARDWPCATWNVHSSGWLLCRGAAEKDGVVGSLGFQVPDDLIAALQDIRCELEASK